MSSLKQLSFEDMPAEILETGEGFVMFEDADHQMLFDWLRVESRSMTYNSAVLTGRATLSAAEVLIKYSRKHGDGFATFKYGDQAGEHYPIAIDQPEF